jgi:hypothetical protein
MEYPNSGSLWPAKERKSDKHPNLRGSIKMDPDLLQEMINQSGGGLVEIDLGGWTKEYNGKKFISLKGGMPYKKDQPQAAKDDDQDTIPF